MAHVRAAHLAKTRHERGGNMDEAVVHRQHGLMGTSPLFLIEEVDTSPALDLLAGH